jgi:hypothetical protein
MIEKIIYPPWISKKMLIRFDNLEFCADSNNILYSLKSYNDTWDFQTKCLWLRSIGVTPENIAKRFDLNVNTLKNREFLGLLTLDYPDKNFKVIIPDRDDWSEEGYVDIRNDRYTFYGGAPCRPERETGQYEMDGELNQLLHDIQDRAALPTPEPTNESTELFKQYYGDYKD